MQDRTCKSLIPMSDKHVAVADCILQCSVTVSLDPGLIIVTARAVDTETRAKWEKLPFMGHLHLQ